MMLSLIALFLGLALSIACNDPALTIPASATPEGEQPTAASPKSAFSGIPEIVDPNNMGWPRVINALNGRITVAKKPERIHTLSLGFDEITYALVPPERVVAVGAFTKDPSFSNVSSVAQDAPTVGRDPEQILSRRPDIVLASPSTRIDTVVSLSKANVPVIQLELENNVASRINSILLLGYIYGEEETALSLAAKLKSRYETVQRAITSNASSTKPKVISLTSYNGLMYVAGSRSVEGSVIEAAGGLNSASSAGLRGNPAISLEGLISLNPDLVIVPMSLNAGEDFKKSLLENPVVAHLNCIKEQKIMVVPPKLFTTLSYWNMKGVEHLSYILWPGLEAKLGKPPFP